MQKYMVLFLLTMSLRMNAQTQITPSKVTPTSFAIIVDDKTYAAASKELTDYKTSVENDGLGTYLIHASWKNPDQVKAVLKKLYTDTKQPLEGAVFVGDIPIPMLRGAQHLTSAFKMSESIAWNRSSVASDRFYDDFDLQFDFLKRDDKDSNYFYYQLKPESPQYLEMDIYTGRIKPPVSVAGESGVAQIKRYLQKLVAVRKEQNPLDHMAVSTAYGYNSESTLSWGGEMVALRSSFPQLFKTGSEIKFLNYRNARFLKSILIPTLQREDMDFVFMTGHGTEETQMMNGYPLVSVPGASMENVARYIRSKVRTAKENGKNLDYVKSNYQQQFGLNDKWFADIFSQDRIREDSLFDNDLEINKNDLKNINARVAYINSCLTGSFHESDYLAGHYLFSEGKNVVSLGNTVGVLQDLWGTQLLGILPQGVRVGHLLKKTAFLETHIFGDPTFHFQADNQEKYNTLFGKKNTAEKYWSSLLQTKDADIQAYALTELFKQKSETVFSPLLLSYFENSTYESVRLQAYFLLRKYQNKDFQKALRIALSDNYEYLKRKAVYDAIDNGGDEYIDPMVAIYRQDREAERIVYKINSLFQFNDFEKVSASLIQQFKDRSSVYGAEELYKEAVKKLSSGHSDTEKSEKILRNQQATDKELLSQIRTLRAYRNHRLVPAVLDLIKNENTKGEIRVAALEALSWFGFSIYQKDIIATCRQMIQLHSGTLLAAQALKTQHIINDAGKRQL